MKSVVLMLALIPAMAGAAEWKKVFGDYEYDVYVDTTRIERAGDSVQAWVQQHFTQERDAGDFFYNILTGLNSFDCLHKKVHLLQVEVYMDDKLLEAHKASRSGGNRPIIPGTVEHFAYKYLCAAKQK